MKKKNPPNTKGIVRSLQLFAFRLQTLNVRVAQNCQEGVGIKASLTPFMLSFRKNSLKSHRKHWKAAHPVVGWLEPLTGEAL